jgi:hypothetical protein
MIFGIYMPLHPDVIEVATKIRYKVAAWVRNDQNIDPDMTGACAIASYTLWRTLRAKGRRAVLVMEGNGHEAHCWVELSGYVIDITATQFDGPDVAIFKVGEDPEWWTEWSEAMKFNMRVTNSKAFNAVKEWGDQSPLKYKRKIESLVSHLTQEPVEI